MFRRRKRRETDLRITPSEAFAEAARGHDGMLLWMPQSPFNPYPQMLYQKLGEARMGQLGIDPHQLDIFAHAASASNLPVVFHHHWTGWVLGGELDSAVARGRLERAFQLLDAISDFPLIWTLHNPLPHECAHLALEIDLRHRLIEQADLIHIMNPRSRDVVSAHYELPEGKVHEIPHPDFAATFPRLPTRARARQRLGFEHDHAIAAFIGQIRTYKNLDLLLDAQVLVSGSQLVVAGATGEDPIAAMASARSLATPSVARIEGHLTDDHLLHVVAAANVVVLPYHSVLNSGIVELARSFGRHLIVPDTRPLRAITDQLSTTYFEPDNAHSLADALAQRVDDPSPHSRGTETPTRFAGMVSDLLHLNRSAEKSS